MDFYMVEIFESSSMTFSSSWAAIIVRVAEITSKLSYIVLAKDTATFARQTNISF